jgi:hypothetical protein
LNLISIDPSFSAFAKSSGLPHNLLPEKIVDRLAILTAKGNISGFLNREVDDKYRLLLWLEAVPLRFDTDGAAQRKMGYAKITSNDFV